MTTLTTESLYYSLDDASWHAFDGAGPVFPINPGVVVNEARISSIDYLSSPWAAGYSRIINSSSATTVTGVRGTMRFSSLSYGAGFAYDHGTRIIGGAEVPAGVAQDGYHVITRDDGLASAVQAYLWRITGNVTHRNNAIAILNCYKDVESFGPGGFLANTPYKPLCIGLAMENMTQALSILGDFPGRDAMVANFATYWWPSLYHWVGGNWLASFANARMGIAVAAGDKTLWDASLAYFDQVIKANIWITSDGAFVNRLPPNPVNGGQQAGSAYPAHWWNQVPTDRSSALLVNGQNCEFKRDDQHLQMGQTGLLHGVMTVQHQTGTGYETYGPRLIASLEMSAASIVTKLNTGVTPSGGYGWQNGWLTALSVFGEDVVPNVAELVTLDAEIRNPQTNNQHVMQGLLFPLGT